MERFEVVLLIIAVVLGAGFIAILVGSFSGENVVYRGYVIDTEYSQSGVGSDDITVVYFENDTLIIYDTVEVDRNKYVEITVFEFSWPGNQNVFVSIEYPNVKSR